MPRPLAALFLFGWAAVCLLLHLPAMTAPGGMAGAASGGAGLTWAQLRVLSWNTVYTSAGAAILAVCWAIVPALTAARLLDGRTRQVFMLISVAPLLVPSVVHAVVAVRLTNPGAPLAFLADLVYTTHGALVVLAWAYSPIAFLCLQAGFRQINPSLLDAALLEANPVRALLGTTMGSAVGFLFTAGVLVALLAAVDLSVAESLLSLPMLTRQIFVQFGVYYDPGGAMRAALPLLAVILTGVAIVGAIVGRLAVDWETEDESHSRPFAGRFLSIRLMLVAGWVLAAAPPLVLMATLLATLGMGDTTVWQSIRSTAGLARKELVYTTWLAAGTAIGCVVLGGLVGSCLAALRKPMPWRLMLMAVFLIPGPLTGVAVKRLLLPDPGSVPASIESLCYWLDGTALPLMMVWIIRFVPFCAYLVERALRRIPSELREAAAVEGAGVLGHLRIWYLPSAWPALMAGGLIVFALAFGETASAVLLVPPGPTTVGLRLMTLMHYAPGGQVSALCLLLCLPMIVAASVFVLLMVIGWWAPMKRAAQP
jgi:iron(III) transport system permease protein